MRGCPPRPAGGSGSRSTLSDLAHKREYIGQKHGLGYAGVRQGHHPSSRMDYDNAVLLPEGTVVPLVPVAQWEKVQETLKRNKAEAVRSSRHADESLLRTRVRCGQCGRLLYYRVRTRKGDGAVLRTYSCCTTHPDGTRCSTQIGAIQFERAVWSRLVEFLSNPKAVERYVADLRVSDPTADALSFQLKQQKDNGRQRENLMAALGRTDDETVQKSILDQIARLSESAASIAQAIAALEDERAAWRGSQERLGTLAAWIHARRADLDAATVAERRRVLADLDLVVCVNPASHPTRWEIVCRIPWAPPRANAAFRTARIDRTIGGTHFNRVDSWSWFPGNVVSRTM